MVDSTDVRSRYIILGLFWKKYFHGLDLVSKKAERVTGCDIDETNLEIAMDTYNSHPKVIIRKMDAEKLLFDDHSINTILLFETIYYINKVKNFFSEAHRILKKGG